LLMTDILICGLRKLECWCILDKHSSCREV
jgi:hypothetical protein